MIDQIIVSDLEAPEYGITQGLMDYWENTECVLEINYEDGEYVPFKFIDTSEDFYHPDYEELNLTEEEEEVVERILKRLMEDN